jgi:hypothetical protein
LSFSGFRCPACSNTMAKKMVDTKLGYREAWHCDCCDEFYSERRLKEILSSS